MLQAIRERAQGWIAWVIVGLIAIPFALWGIGSYTGIGGEPVVAVVDGVDISQRAFDQRYHNTRMELRDRLGSAYRPEMFDEKQLRRQVLDDMVREQLVLDKSRALGLRASDQEVRLTVLSNPAFQANGRFDTGIYETRLRQNGMVPIQYEDRVRQGLLSDQLRRAIMATEVVTGSEIDSAIRLTLQKRDLSYVMLPVASFASDEAVPEAEILAFYEANRARFETPEQVKVEYLDLDAQHLPGVDSPSDDQLRAAYDAHPERFGQPERRRARHILISVPKGGDADAEAAAKAGIEAARQRIASGEAFEVVAQEVSQDPGTKAKGGDLGEFGRGVMDPAFEEAVFTLSQGQLSEPVRSRFGYHLIETTAVVPASIKPFEEVKPELIVEVSKQEAAARFFDLSERLATLAYESPDSLVPAAEQLGIEVQTSDWIPRPGGPGVFASPKVLTAAFSDDLVKQGVNSEIIEPDKDRMQAVVLRVLEHRDASFKPLDEVREEIVAAVQQERARSAALAAAEVMSKQIAEGASRVDAFAEYKVEQPGTVTRNDRKLPKQILDLAFRLPSPPEGSLSSGAVVLDDGAALVLLSKVEDGSLEATQEGAQEREAKAMAQAIGSQEYTHLVEDLEARATIERKPLSEGSALE